MQKKAIQRNLFLHAKGNWQYRIEEGQKQQCFYSIQGQENREKNWGQNYLAQWSHFSYLCMKEATPSSLKPWISKDTMRFGKDKNHLADCKWLKVCGLEIEVSRLANFRFSMFSIRFWNLEFRYSVRFEFWYLKNPTILALVQI